MADLASKDAKYQKRKKKKSSATTCTPSPQIPDIRTVFSAKRSTESKATVEIGDLTDAPEDGTLDPENNLDSNPLANKLTVKESLGDFPPKGKDKGSQNCATPTIKMSAEKMEDLTGTSEINDVQAREAIEVNENCLSTLASYQAATACPSTPLCPSAVAENSLTRGDPESENCPECEDDKDENFLWKGSDIKNQET